jgi:hypothetical protein
VSAAPPQRADTVIRSLTALRQSVRGTGSQSGGHWIGGAPPTRGGGAHGRLFSPYRSPHLRQCTSYRIAPDSDSMKT